MQALFILAFIVLSIFLIGLILIQRGRGGGLAGAFGGMGGQSAFGTKAGDVFTKITVVAAGLMFLLCILAILYLKHGQHGLTVEGGGLRMPQQQTQSAPVESVPAP